MKREELIEIVRRAAASRGFAFHTGEEHKINGTVRVYPAAWLVPPAAKSAKGRTEGELVYRIALHLAALPSSGESDALWAELETGARGIAAEIAAEAAVCSVTGISLTPARGSLTVHGEVSVTLECDVTMWYYL